MRHRLNNLYATWGKTIAYLALFSLFLSFILHQKKEVFDLQTVLRHAQPGYLVAGLVCAVATVAMHGAFYRSSLQHLNKNIPYPVILRLFLKRFFISTFIPAGFAASQYTLSSELEKYDVQPTEGYIASTIYIIVGGLSFVVVLVPALILLAAEGNASWFIWAASGLTVVLTAAWVWEASRLFKQEGILYRILKKHIPDLEGILSGQAGTHLVRDIMLRMLPYSLVIDLLGAITLTFAARCLGVHLTMAQALMGYIVNILVLTVSPLFQGVGFVEVSLVYLLRQFGVGFSEAITVTLIYRFYQMWVPFFAGFYLIIRPHLKHVWRHLPAIFTGLLGVVNIFSYFRPASPLLGRISDFQDILSTDYFTLTRGMVLALGIGLLLLSVYLYQEMRLAWGIAVAMVVLSIVSHVISGIDVPEVVVAVLVLSSLLMHHKEYQEHITLRTP